METKEMSRPELTENLIKEFSAHVFNPEKSETTRLTIVVPLDVKNTFDKQQLKSGREWGKFLKELLVDLHRKVEAQK